MSSIKAAVYALEQAEHTLSSAIELIRVASADTEPAPVSVVLTRDRSNGRIHRRARIEGIPGYLTYEADNLDSAGAFDVIPDLSAVRSEGEFCERCFGPLNDADAVTSAEAATEEYAGG